MSIILFAVGILLFTWFEIRELDKDLKPWTEKETRQFLIQQHKVINYLMVKKRGRHE